MRAYVNAQSPKSISAMIHHSIVAAKIFLLVATKMVVQASERKERPLNGERPPTNANRVKNDKKKDKGLFKGKNCLSPEEMECYRKENQCYKCGEQVMHIILFLSGRLRMTNHKHLRLQRKTRSKRMMHHAHVMHGAKCVTKIVLSCLT